VRDSRDAQVLVLMTALANGGGGQLYTVAFLGQREFAGRADTLTYSSRATDTGDEVRRDLAHTLKLGLVRYAAGTRAARHLRVEYRPPEDSAAAGREGLDPWNHWVFRLSTSGNLSGEATSTSRNLSGSVAANRTTEMWKIELSASGHTGRSSYRIDDTTTYVSRSQRYQGEAIVVRSLGPHWSAGAYVGIYSSTFINQDLQVEGGPAVEFDVFPYAEATRRQLRISYRLSAARVDYREVTLYGKLSETLYSHVLDVSYEVRQPWGGANVSLNGTQYLHDPGKFSVGLHGGLEVRLVRGLSVNASGNYERVRNQLYLPAGTASPEEILVRQRQLATGYRYYTNLGLSYRFGSVYNNVVNPRFGI
jgi:hypothetical protein